MEKIQLKAQIREEIGKKFTKKLRKEGLVPAIVYKEGKKTAHLKINEKDLFNTLHTKAGENVLINLKIGEEQKGKDRGRVVIIKEVQHHPIREQILHVDLQEISLTEKLTLEVPIVVKGEAEGVVKDEGVLEHVIWEVKAECLPEDIPEKIEVNVAHMKIGDSILVKDLQTPPKVKILADPEQTVISVVPPYVEKVEEVAEEITEPELIRKEKEEEAVEEGAEKAPPEEKRPSEARESRRVIKETGKEAKKEGKKEEKEGKK